MKRNIKVTYALDGFNKFVKGTLLNEDGLFLTVKSREGSIFRIKKENISEIKEWNEMDVRK